MPCQRGCSRTRRRDARPTAGAHQVALGWASEQAERAYQGVPPRRCASVIYRTYGGTAYARALEGGSVVRGQDASPGGRRLRELRASSRHSRSDGQLALPFFILTAGLALASVEEQEMDPAVVLMNFLRTNQAHWPPRWRLPCGPPNPLAITRNSWAASTQPGACGPCLGRKGCRLTPSMGPSTHRLPGSRPGCDAGRPRLGDRGDAHHRSAVRWLAPETTRVIEPGAGGGQLIMRPPSEPG